MSLSAACRSASPYRRRAWPRARIRRRRAGARPACRAHRAAGATSSPMAVEATGRARCGRDHGRRGKSRPASSKGLARAGWATSTLSPMGTRSSARQRLHHRPVQSASPRAGAPFAGEAPQDLRHARGPDRGRSVDGIGHQGEREPGSGIMVVRLMKPWKAPPWPNHFQPARAADHQPEAVAEIDGGMGRRAIAGESSRAGSRR